MPKVLNHFVSLTQGHNMNKEVGNSCSSSEWVLKFMKKRIEGALVRTSAKSDQRRNGEPKAVFEQPFHNQCGNPIQYASSKHGIQDSKLLSHQSV